MDKELSPIKNKSVYTDALAKALENIPEEMHEYSEDTLRDNIKPTLKLYQIKQNFWVELTAASTDNRKMVMDRVFNGVVSKEYFYRAVLKNPAKMAWIIHPLTTYENRIDAALQRATERYEDLVNMDITTVKKRKEGDEWVEYTEVDAKKASVLLSVIKQLEDRKLGVAVQRQVNITKTEDKINESPVESSKIDEKIKEIERKLGSMGDVVDV